MGRLSKDQKYGMETSGAAAKYNKRNDNKFKSGDSVPHIYTKQKHIKQMKMLRICELIGLPL